MANMQDPYIVAPDRVKQIVAKRQQRDDADAWPLDDGSAAFRRAGYSGYGLFNTRQNPRPDSRII